MLFLALSLSSLRKFHFKRTISFLESVGSLDIAQFAAIKPRLVGGGDLLASSSQFAIIGMSDNVLGSRCDFMMRDDVNDSEETTTTKHAKLSFPPIGVAAASHFFLLLCSPVLI